MPFLDNTILDAGLSILDTTGNRLDICSAEPTTFSQATSSLTLGNFTSLSIGAPASRTPNGRRVTVAAITTGMTASATGTATHWAISDTGNSRLLATGALSASQAVTSGNAITLAAFDIGIPAAV